MTDSTSHEGAEESRAVKVGVLLDQEPDEIGEWLADMAAFDAAGADALWVDSGPEPEWDVLALTAALAVVTFRLRLVLALPDSSAPSAGLARTLDTIGRLSHGRLALVADSSRCEELAVVAPRVGIFRRLPGEPGIFEGPGEEDEVERWELGPAPQGRESWRDACADAAGRGARGLVVPADPQLLDILRNPDDLGDRRDLQIAQG